MKLEATKAIVLVMLSFALTTSGQVCTPCLTMEQTNAQYNQNLANKVVVVNTATQQQQCYYQQLATYWQQKDKDNQQKAKDIQQLAKDQQQKDKDAQQIAMDKTLAEKAACLCTPNSGYDEVLRFIEVIMPYVPDTSPLKPELKTIHTNRSGQADFTNPGGQTHNLLGFDNPSYTINNAK